MKKLIISQGLAADQLERLAHSFRSSTTPKTTSYLKRYLETLVKLHESYHSTHGHILATLSGNVQEIEVPYFKNSEVTRFEECYITIHAELEELLKTSSEATPSGSGQDNTVRNRDSEVKLHRISLPQFDGDYNKWTSFKDLFVSLVHNKETLSNVEKMHYLKTCLKGEPEHLLSSYLVIDSNYDIAWNTLLQRYDNRGALLHGQFKKLVVIDSVSESSVAIKNLLDRSMEAVQLLESMAGEDNLFHSLVVYLVVQRLPKHSRELWEQQQAPKKNIYCLSDLKSFLHIRFRALEATHQSVVTKIHSHHISASQSQVNCYACKDKHPLRTCPRFFAANQKDRYTIVKQNHLCLNCLAKGHSGSNCPSKFRCLKCNSAHHTMLHKNNVPDISRSSTEIGSSTQPTINSLSTTTIGNVLLPTALVEFHNAGRRVVLRALLDQGSQASLITEEASQRLGLKKQVCQAVVTGVGGKKTSQVRGRATVVIRALDGQELSLKVFVLPRLTNLIPSKCFDKLEHTQLANIKLADPLYNVPGRIDAIFGAEIYAKLMLSGTNLLNDVLLQNTKLGWILSGNVEHNNCSNSIQSLKIEIREEDDIKHQLKKFWELEEPAQAKFMNADDRRCEEIFKETYSRDETGRFTVRLPFKNSDSMNQLGDSRYSAQASLKYLETKFERNPDLKQDYVECIQTYIRSGFLSPVEATKIVDNRVVHYLPHHAVRKDSTTTKTRVVFDASRKTSSGKSINELLFSGPPIQNDIVSILSNWRFFKYAFVADIEKMFFQINLHPDDRDYQRVLWRTDSKEKVREYRLNTVTFGFTCAPYLAIRALHQLAEDGRSSHPKAAETILNDFYVDDVLSGGDTIGETKEKQKQLCDLLKSAGFHLRKWVVNEPKLLEGIPIEDIESVDVLDLKQDKSYKSLGIQWHPIADTFSYDFRFTCDDTIFTKRMILSEIARLYDPLGWIAPVIVKAKCIMQNLWIHGIDWDELPNKEIAEEWSKLQSQFAALNEIRIPRCINTNSCEVVEIHGFCDASQNAYAAVIYIVARGRNSEVNLAMAKTRVAPVRTITIPRLELCGALLLAKLIKQFTESSKGKLKIERTWLWTDSRIVLAWLQGHPSRWNIFVANRTTQITEAVPNASWMYVPSGMNPADVASRGIYPQHLSNCSIWWNGPRFLAQNSCHWPRQEDIPPTQLEAKKEANLLCHNLQIEASELDSLIMRFSTLTRLVRTTAYCFRFIKIASRRLDETHFLTTRELEAALKFWIAYSQRKHFADDIHKLQRDKSISRSSKLRNLNPFIDQEGLLRVGGRLSYANMSFDEMHPIILPKEARLSELLIEQTHKATMHGEIQLMLATIRKRFWIMDARNLVRKCIFKCIQCFRTKAKTSSQLMGTLPAPRVNITRPFTHVGVDYCGPIDIKDRRGRGGRISKGYICIFICLAVKAIHIEVVNDLTTSAFLAALKRFVSRRGLCTDLYSDCGSNFVGADLELKRTVIANRRAFEELANQGIRWHFNPPASPHFGGLWEAGVKSIKQHLRRTIGNVVLTYEELSTTLSQIEACLNSRPLGPLHDDPTDATAITPAHFLIGDTLLNVPEKCCLNDKLSYRDRWQLTQKLAQSFWSIWTKEYLSRLQQRPKWLSQEPSPKIGDICLVKDDRSPPYKWLLARIIALHPGRDNLVRVVTLKRDGNTFQRNITKIALLPVSHTNSQQA